MNKRLCGKELQAYYTNLITPEIHELQKLEEGTGPVRRKLVEQLGEDGWIAMGWPEEYGGQGKSAIEQFIFYDETMRVGSPAPMLTINTVGPTIMEYGTDEQKDFFFRRSLRENFISVSGTANLMLVQISPH